MSHLPRTVCWVRAPPPRQRMYHEPADGCGRLVPNCALGLQVGGRQGVGGGGGVAVAVRQGAQLLQPPRHCRAVQRESHVSGSIAYEQYACGAEMPKTAARQQHTDAMRCIVPLPWWHSRETEELYTRLHQQAGASAVPADAKRCSPQMSEATMRYSGGCRWLLRCVRPSCCTCKHVIGALLLPVDCSVPPAAVEETCRPAKH